MTNREIVYHSLEVIDENLKTGLTVQEIADRLGYSVYYFIRLFSGITGLTPKVYVNRRKITGAWEDLQRGSRKIVDVALDYGFGTPESFSRAFRRQLGVNPSQVIHGVDIDRRGIQPPITPEGLERLRNSPRQEPELVERKPLYLAGLSTLYEEDMPDDLSAPWKMLTDHVSAISNRVKPERYYQVQYWMPNQNYKSLFFFVAVETEGPAEAPFHFSTKTLPGQYYLKFLHYGASNQVGRTYEYIYSTYLPETNYKLPHLFNFEYYPPDHKGPYSPDSVSEIFIPVTINETESLHQNASK